MIRQAHRDLHKETWHWEECQDQTAEMKRFWPGREPEEPEVGQGWYDESSDCLYVWDGREWACLPTD